MTPRSAAAPGERPHCEPNAVGEKSKRLLLAAPQRGGSKDDLEAGKTTELLKAILLASPSPYPVPTGLWSELPPQPLCTSRPPILPTHPSPAGHPQPGTVTVPMGQESSRGHPFCFCIKS